MHGNGHAGAGLGRSAGTNGVVTSKGQRYRGRVAPRSRFGLFEFDAEAGTLSREGVPQRLQPQPARMLGVLLERPGELVTRETLRQRLWPDGTSVDFERGLNFCAAQLRSALHDSAESPRYVETVPRRGYRFIAAVTAIPSTPTARQRPSGRGRWLAAAAFLLAVAGMVAALAMRQERSSAAVRVAVVPFDNDTGEKSFDQVAVAVSDATVARLVAADTGGRLRVIGNSAPLRRPRAFRDLKAIAREVRADYILLAQMKADAAGVRLIAHLIRSEDEAHVWAATFDRRVFTLEAQGAIADDIVAAVSSRLTAAPQN